MAETPPRPTAAGRATSRTQTAPRPTRRHEAATLVANIDGGARGNPGEAGFGVFIRDEAGAEVDSLYGYLGHRTNNVAEYAALLAVLRYAVAHDVASLRILSDSELLVRQIGGQYRVKNPGLQVLHRRAVALMARLGRVTVEHVRREQNRDADRLANEAMDSRGERPEGVTAGLLE